MTIVSMWQIVVLLLSNGTGFPGGFFQKSPRGRWTKCGQKISQYWIFLGFFLKQPYFYVSNNLSELPMSFFSKKSLIGQKKNNNISKSKNIFLSNFWSVNFANSIQFKIDWNYVLKLDKKTESRGIFPCPPGNPSNE